MDLPSFPYSHVHGMDDTYPQYARQRASDPVPLVRLASGGQAYLATRYADVRRILSDPVFSRAALCRPGAVVLTETSRLPHIMLNMDPPDHTRLRRLVTRAFTTGAVERLRPRVAEIAGGLVEDMVEHGPPVDFVAAFATALPALVISDLLGVPPADRLTVCGWVDVMLSTGAYTLEEHTAAMGELMAYLQQLIAAKRAEPAEDLVSSLIAARDEDDKLSEAELLNTVFLLIAGGFETTASLLANSVLTLHRHPDQWALLRERPEVLPGAVEEMLRYVPISWSSLERVTTADTELAGVRIPAGSTVIPMTYAANHDTALTAEAERLDLTRAPLPHLAFGHGIHRCVGAPLAKLELQTAFATLSRRLPGLRPALPESALTWKMGMMTVGPVTLPVQW
jgi:cytochrome P450